MPRHGNGVREPLTVAGGEAAVLPPSSLCCPITHEVMEDPVVAHDGQSYEYTAILEWLRTHQTSPVTNVELRSKTLLRNFALRSAITEWRERVVGGPESEAASSATTRSRPARQGEHTHVPGAAAARGVGAIAYEEPSTAAHWRPRGGCPRCELSPGRWRVVLVLLMLVLLTATSVLVGNPFFQPSQEDGANDGGDGGGRGRWPEPPGPGPPGPGPGPPGPGPGPPGGPCPPFDPTPGAPDMPPGWHWQPPRNSSLEMQLLAPGWTKWAPVHLEKGELGTSNFHNARLVRIDSINSTGGHGRDAAGCVDVGGGAVQLL
jgi:hypothetical protein